ncbi:Flp family type IVb pilin [Methylobacterium sp. J-077]|uniref:Flp family type IVb pilin n=1 Tax=Methylobacterium sp. J-077 TaxID=2836656 RepID=UPI001FBA0811|nr:Flp family type IVb pilin [Methylobacterium sp. J-077]MCJ2121249.1 Flp family type IVb pilin [Methylobacterium sp. J-077]
MSRAARFARDARGTTAMEYALIGALIFVVVAGSIRYYGSRMIPIYAQISSAVTQAN